MFNIHLPGRDIEEDDHEAQCALDTIFRSEEILLTSDPAFLARLSGELQKKQAVLDMVQELLPQTEEMDEELEGLNGEERVDDFFSRLMKKDMDEAMKESETPDQRRARLKRGTRDGILNI